MTFSYRRSPWTWQPISEIEKGRGGGGARVRDRSLITGKGGGGGGVTKNKKIAGPTFRPPPAS